MKISYCITVCNEFVEIQRLVTHLLTNKREEDEIVILYDQTNGDLKIEEFLRSKSINGEFNWHTGSFQGNFSDWKNKLSQLSSGDYIFNIDADEIPHQNLLNSLPEILQLNPEADLILVPRINTVEGLTQDHINKWNWNTNQQGWINWPDYQGRIYKNKPEIKWQGKVHETIQGCNQYSFLSPEEIWALYHPKDIKRQEKQNKLYNSL